MGLGPTIVPAAAARRPTEAVREERAYPCILFREAFGVRRKKGKVEKRKGGRKERGDASPAKRGKP
jgi:hypothetical protein